MDGSNVFMHELLDDERFIQWVFHSTPELESYWQDKIKENPDKKENTLELKNLLSKIRIRESCLSDNDKKMLWEDIASGSIYKKRTIDFRRWLKYTASVVGIILTLGGGYLVYERIHGRSSVDYLSILSKEDDCAKKAGNIRLILPNQEEIEIPDINVEFIHNKKGDIQVNTEQVIPNCMDESGGKENLQFNQLIVPYGHNSSLVLSDGTKIWVNSGSKLIYPQRFAGDRREIFIEGEAYLEVAKNEKIPFFVKTELWEIKVTGTSFNVCAYKGELFQSIVLATGSVNVKNLVSREKVQLKPNQMCLYEYGLDKIKVEEVEIYDYICWKYGFLHFKSERLDLVLNRLKRFYNISIECSDKVKKIRVSGKLDMKEDINEVFKTITVTAPVKYTREKNKIIIDVKPLK
ncbi:MAG: FecR family protein [Dysgonamonadaceae bacterium]|nr:FecR family protein [Dysgonamonadaceae bacterium]